jgi:hypothetical protein
MCIRRTDGAPVWRCALPPLRRYPSVDELVARAAALAARHPRDAVLRRVGTSRAGTPLWLLAWCAEYRDGFGARWIPVGRQAEFQAHVVLAVFELAYGHARVGSLSGEPGWGTRAAVPMHRE